MQINNESAFSCFVFESLDARDAAIEVVICRGTFDIVGSKLIPSATQQPIVLSDQYRNQPLTSSVCVDTDLVPQKLAADITLNSIAHAPTGKPLPSWPVSVRVGRVSKVLRVLGPRYWQFSLWKGWTLTKPEATLAVPIHYELAFGGRYQHKENDIVFEPNPVGLGFASARSTDRSATIAAPQIENADRSIVEFGKEYEPAGLGPIAKHCLPRRNLCGTADDHWKETRWPLRPIDFDFRYYNCSTPGLLYPGFLQGDEEVLLTGLSASGPIQFSLPGISLLLFALDQNREITLDSMSLDTLHIDTTTMQVSLTWRMTIPKTSGLKSIQIMQQRVDPAEHTALSKVKSYGR